METLDHEKFKGVQELAAIGAKIAAGTAALSTLKSSEESYLAEREQKLVERLRKALADSADLIEAIGANHSALVGYKNELSSFHDSILSLIQGVDACMGLITAASTDLDARITEHEQNVVSFKQSSAQQRAQIDGHREELNLWSGKLANTEHLLNDRMAMLERTIARNKK